MGSQVRRKAQDREASPFENRTPIRSRSRAPAAPTTRRWPATYFSHRTGSGIGLTVVRELITAHGGDVRAANATDGGAVFTVTLPLAASGQVATRESAGLGQIPA